MKANPEKLIDLIDDPSEFLIIVCLHMLPSMNLKKISHLTNLPESSALRKIKELIRFGHIYLDQNATMNKRGKYYKLSDKLTHILDREDDDSFNFKSYYKKERNHDTMVSLMDAFEALTSLNGTLTHFFTQNVKAQIRDFKHIKKLKQTLKLSMMDLSLQNETEKEEVNEIVKDFLTKMSKFDRKTQNHQDKSPNHNLFISIYPIGEFEVEGEKGEEEDGEDEEDNNETD